MPGGGRGGWNSGWFLLNCAAVPALDNGSEREWLQMVSRKKPSLLEVFGESIQVPEGPESWKIWVLKGLRYKILNSVHQWFKPKHNGYNWFERETIIVGSFVGSRSRDTPTVGRTTLRRTTLRRKTIRRTTHSRTT